MSNLATSHIFHKENWDRRLISGVLAVCLAITALGKTPDTFVEIISLVGVFLASILSKKNG